VAIVCTGKKSTWARLRKPVSGVLMLLFLLPGASFGAKPPTAAQCNAELALSPFPAGQETQGLDFGSTLVGTAGTVTIDPLTGTLTGVHIPSSIGKQAIVHFSTGTLDCSSLQPTVTLTPGSISNGTSTMTISNLVYTTDITKKNQKKFNTGDFYIGADITFTGTETSGPYSGGGYTITIVF